MGKRRKIMIEVDGYTIAVLKALVKQADQQQQVVKRKSEYTEDSTMVQTRQLSVVMSDSVVEISEGQKIE